jgi:hypothetical protein
VMDWKPPKSAPNPQFPRIGGIVPSIHSWLL